MTQGTWTRRPLAQAPQDRRILLEDHRGNFAVASWRPIPGAGPAWLVSEGKGVAVTFEDAAAWYELPETGR